MTWEQGTRCLSTSSNITSSQLRSTSVSNRARVTKHSYNKMYSIYFKKIIGIYKIYLDLFYIIVSTKNWFNWKKVIFIYLVSSCPAIFAREIKLNKSSFWNNFLTTFSGVKNLNNCVRCQPKNLGWPSTPTLLPHHRSPPRFGMQHHTPSHFWHHC